MAIRIGGVEYAKFTHASGIGLRLQVFLKVKDREGRIACLRLEEDPERWLLPGEMMLLNENPDDGAKRVAKTWFQTALEPRLSQVVSFPATGGEDTKWYLILVYEADAPADLKGTPDTVEVRFVEPGKAPGEWGYAHGDVFPHLR